MTFDLKIRLILMIDGTPWKIMDFTHIKMARASAVVRTRLKNMISGGVIDRTFRPGETIPECEIIYKNVEFSHADDESLVFISDDDDEEEISVPIEIVSNPEIFTAGMVLDVTVSGKMIGLLLDLECVLLMWNDKVVEIQLPNKLEFEVNDITGSSQRTATLSCGLDVVVPAFVKVGDRIFINSSDLKYHSRAEKYR